MLPRVLLSKAKYEPWPSGLDPVHERMYNKSEVSSPQNGREKSHGSNRAKKLLVILLHLDKLVPGV